MKYKVALVFMAMAYVITITVFAIMLDDANSRIPTRTKVHIITKTVIHDTFRNDRSSVFLCTPDDTIMMCTSNDKLVQIKCTAIGGTSKSYFC